MENPQKTAKRKSPWLKIHDELEIGPIAKDDRPLAEFVARHAKERPDAPALLFFDKIISFTEYDTSTSRLANALRNLGIGKGDVVGFLMPNLPQYAFAVAACSRLGAIGTGLSPLCSPPELAYQISDAKAQVVIALSDLVPKLQAMPDIPDCLSSVIITDAMDDIAPGKTELPDMPGVNVVSYCNIMSEASDECAQVPTDWNDTFMIQYTGGTTGKPKGAQLSIRNIMHNPLLSNSLGAPLEMGKEVWASPFPLFHIAGLFSVASAARQGTLFFLLPDPRDLAQLVKQMQQFPPTLIGAVPALTEMLMATPGFEKVDLSRLKTWGSGAAPISSQTVAELCQRVGEGKLSDSFGMTETSGAYIANPPKRYKFGSVGIPLPETDLRIMDVEKGDVEVPAGEPGELCVSGPQVMKGYLNLPDETANALREIDGRTYMYSGDVGYMDEEGFVFLCDRAKDMLIVGGYKVFSVEIEDKLKSLPMVEASAIVGKADEDRPGNDIVHLFVQLTEDHRNRDEDELRSELMTYFAENMAIYKKPRAIHFVDAIPLTPIGKIDKKLLRAEL